MTNITGRDLIIYILQNNLEDEPVFHHGTFIGYDTVDNYAKEREVGSETVKAWIELGNLKGCISIGDTYLIPKYDLMMKERVSSILKGAENENESN